MTEYIYDVFISYAREDEEWAKKLQTDLIASGIKKEKIFLDSIRINVAREWETQIHTALEGSRCMVVLWSKLARNSDWVTKETSYFDVKYRSDNDRYLIIIVLNEEPRAFASLQVIYDLKQIQAYEKGIQQLDVNLWSKVLKKITDSLEFNDKRKPIQLAVLTTIRPRLEKVDFNRLSFGASLNNILQQSGLGITRDKVLNNYGDEYSDWKPFGGIKNITTILEELLQSINKITKRFDVTFRWLQIDPARFWSNIQEDVVKELSVLTDNPAVIIIDPIALYDDNVRDRFNMLGGCFENKEALIMTFSPFQLSPDFLSWRAIIQNVAWTFHSNFFEPPIPQKNPYAQIYANPVDEKDAQRLLRYILSSQLGVSSNANKTDKPYTKV